MYLRSAFLQLPLSFDAAALAAELAIVPEAAWRPHPEGHAGNVALPLVARGGDPDDDGVAGAMAATPLLGLLPRFQQAMAALDVPIGRSRLMRLDGNAEASAHCDVNYYWQDRHRVHIPIVTTPQVRFVCGDHELHMASGDCWVFDTTRRHKVINPEPTRRIHLVIDTVGSASLSRLLASARDPATVSPAVFVARRVDLPALPAALRFERYNQPPVMSPWELQQRLDALLQRIRASAPALAAPFQAAWVGICAEWRALWAEHADSSPGWPFYDALRSSLAETLAPLRGRLSLEGVDAVDWVVHTVVRPALGALPAPHAMMTPTPPAQAPALIRGRLSRPIFVVAPPCSGARLLLDALAQAAGTAVLGAGRAAVDGVFAELAATRRDVDAVVLSARDAEPHWVERLHAAVQQATRHREGEPGQTPLRLLDTTANLPLQLRFYAAVFPDAMFVYLYRDPREVLAQMIDAWGSRKFVSQPDLLDWSGPPWSFPLIPGWRELNGRPLAEVVARQWSAIVEQALDDLQRLAPQRWCLARYDTLLAEPQAELQRLCTFLHLDWDRDVPAPLPQTRPNQRSPDPDTWRHHIETLAAVRPYFEPAAQRLRDLFAAPPAIAPPQRRAPTQLPANAAAAVAEPDAFRSVFSAAFPALLDQLGVSLAVSTYQSGRLILLRADNGRLNTHLRFFPRPMGIALGRWGLALGTAQHVHHFRNQPAMAAMLEPAGRHDACYLPARSHVTGDIRVHEMAFDADDCLWVVNTRFSCLCTLDAAHSFVPRWRPRFVSALAAEDRCHLNGLAMQGGRVRVVSALGVSDAPQGWREHRFAGGVLIDVDSGELLAHGLAMPHSPRLHDGRLWVLESARGTLCHVEPDGRRETVADLPGFTRGLAFAGHYAFVGLSQVREKLFDGLPLAQRLEQRQCGVWVVDLRSGAVVALLRFEGSVEEIFDVQILPHRYPDIAEIDADAATNAFVLPDAALADLPHRR